MVIPMWWRYLIMGRVGAELQRSGGVVAIQDRMGMGWRGLEEGLQRIAVAHTDGHEQARGAFAAPGVTSFLLYRHYQQGSRPRAVHV